MPFEFAEAERIKNCETAEAAIQVLGLALHSPEAYYIQVVWQALGERIRLLTLQLDAIPLSAISE